MHRNTNILQTYLLLYCKKSFGMNFLNELRKSDISGPIFRILLNIFGKSRKQKGKTFVGRLGMLSFIWIHLIDYHQVPSQQKLPEQKSNQLGLVVENFNLTTTKCFLASLKCISNWTILYSLKLSSRHKFSLLTYLADDCTAQFWSTGDTSCLVAISPLDRDDSFWKVV